MKAHFRFLTLLAILALLILACGVSVDFGTQQPSALDQVSTMVASTLQVRTLEALAAAPSATPSPTITPTATNTLLPATLSVSSATDCYAGPSNQYGFVITVRPGTVVTVMGKDTPDNYWIIEVPGYPGTVCWLSGQYAAVSGDTSSLPAPATPLPSRYTLDEPRGLRASCSSWTEPEDLTDPAGGHEDSQLTVVLRWGNMEPNQTGVRVYRNGYRIATLGPHASSFTDTIWHHDRHRDLTYGVQAFNNTAVSSIVTVDVHHCDD